MSLPRVWLVTGSSSGFGRTMTELVLFKGERVVATARTPADLAEFKSRYPPTQLLVVQLDVVKEEEIKNVFFEAKEAFGRVDVVFNNAGVSLGAEVEGTPNDLARSMFETNFWGAANVSREAVRFFRDENPKGAGGRLLTVGSYAGMSPFGGLGYYSATKAAIGAINEALAEEIDPTWNIKVSMIAPSLVRTNLGHNSAFFPPPPSYAGPTIPLTIGRRTMMAAQDPAFKRDDAHKVITKLYELSLLNDPPLWLPIGLESVSGVKAHLERILKDVETYESWSNDLVED